MSKRRWPTYAMPTKFEGINDRTILAQHMISKHFLMRSMRKLHWPTYAMLKILEGIID